MISICPPFSESEPFRSAARAQPEEMPTRETRGRKQDPPQGCGTVPGDGWRPAGYSTPRSPREWEKPVSADLQRAGTTTRWEIATANRAGRLRRRGPRDPNQHIEVKP